MTKLLLTAALLVLAPLGAWATCYDGHDSASISCPDGTTLDQETGACVETTS